MKAKVLGILISLALCLSLAGVLAPPLSSPVMAATTWNVNPGDSIQSAVDNAAAGDTIIVHAGNYTENVIVNKSLTLQGEGGVVNVTAANSNVAVFGVLADNVTLSGFTATGGWDGIYSLASYCNFVNNTLTNNLLQGILLDGGTDNTIEGCTAIGNGLYDGGGGGGIWLEFTDNNTVEGCTANNNYIGIYLDQSYNNTIEGCTADNNHIGIQLDGTGANILSGNTVSGNTVHGILLNSSSNNQIIGNNILSNGAADSGIHISNDSHDNLIGNNTIENNVDGIGIEGYDNLIINNTIENNDDGIGIEGYDNKIIGNNIFNNTGWAAVGCGIQILGQGLDNVIHLNNIVGNSPEGGHSYGVFSAGAPVDASNNWWGDVTGPSGEGLGSGDAVWGLDYEDYAPWLGAPLVLPAAHYEHLLAGAQQVVDASNEANTTVTLTVSAEESETDIVIARYESQPFAPQLLMDSTDNDTALGPYVDVFVSDPEAVVWPIHVEVSYTDDELATAGIEENTLGLYYYEPGDTFYECEETGVDTENNVVWANVYEYEYGSPRTPFVAGGVPNTPPEAYDQVVYTLQNQPKSITLDADDADGDPLTFSIVTGPSHGTLSGSPPNLTYTPNAGYYGPDSFTFKANDGMDDSNIATVSITVEVPAVGTPTLSQWGIIGMAIVFAAALVWVGGRRLAAKAGS